MTSNMFCWTISFYLCTRQSIFPGIRKGREKMLRNISRHIISFMACNLLFLYFFRNHDKWSATLLETKISKHVQSFSNMEGCNIKSLHTLYVQIRSGNMRIAIQPNTLIQKKLHNVARKKQSRKKNNNSKLPCTSYHRFQNKVGYQIHQQMLLCWHQTEM